MGAIRWDHPDAFDDAVLLAAADGAPRRALRDGLGRVRGRRRAVQLGRYPRFRIVTAATGPDALRRASAATVAVVDLELPKGPGLETIRELREAHPDLAILAFASPAGVSDAMAAVMAGADFFHDLGDERSATLERVVELAIERRALTERIERSEAAMEEARGRLARLSGDLVSAVPGLRPVHAREDVIPFREAARRYLLGATQFFARDPHGLAKALGVSYFSLRRLLARYDVAFPAARGRRR